MFTTILEIITKIRHVLAAITLFDIIFTVIFLLWESVWFIIWVEVALWLFDLSFDVIDILLMNVTYILVDTIIPDPGQSYYNFKRLFVLRFLAWIYKKRHFNYSNSVADLANYYQNLSKAVLQKYYKSKDDNKLKVCIVHKILDDKLPEEKEKAVCTMLNLLEQYKISKNFKKIFEAYKKEHRNYYDI